MGKRVVAAAAGGLAGAGQTRLDTAVQGKIVGSPPV